MTAIFPEEDVPANMKQYIQINRDVFKSDYAAGEAAEVVAGRGLGRRTAAVRPLACSGTIA